jgi:hypothetical protein
MHRDNLVVGCTTKPHDGLFYYSYEYAIALDCPLVIITHPDFEQSDYIDAINEKYTVCKNVVFDEDFFPADETCLLMGRSLLTVPYLNIDKYTDDQLMIMFLLFKCLIVVYSENHPEDYPKAVEYFKSKTYDLCDHEVYPNGVGDHFEKHINFSIYKDPVDDVQFEYLFLGTNKRYYDTVEKTIDKYLDYVDHGILVYDDKYTRRDLNNVYVPVNNLLGKFKTYVYTKDYFDPAPRLIQECKYYGKDIIYARDKNIVDGGSVYYERGIKCTSDGIETIRNIDINI